MESVVALTVEWILDRGPGVGRHDRRVGQFAVKQT